MPLPTAEAAELTAPTVALVAVPAAFSVAVMPLSTASTTASLPRVTAEAAAELAAHTPSLMLLAALRSDPPADLPISQSWPRRAATTSFRHSPDMASSMAALSLIPA